MIHIKDGGASSYQRLYMLAPQTGETFLSEDGTIVVFIKGNGLCAFIRTNDKTPVVTDITVSEATAHHLFKRVEVDLIVRAI